MRLQNLVCLLLAAISACSEYPRDPNGTLWKVRKERSFTVGIVAPLDGASREATVDQLIQRVANATGAAPQLVVGDTELLVKRLEAGTVDLVIGRFDKKSPWATTITIGPPLRIQSEGKAQVQIAPAMQNGENAWIALVEREARQLEHKP